jgi:GST-like protein
MSKYTLYGWHQTGSLAIETALHEASVPFELVDVSTKAQKNLGEAYTKINPRQQLPALRLPDGTIMTEGFMILLHIADAFPAARLAPPPGTTARAIHDRWLGFFAVNVYEGELRKLKPARFTTEEASAKAVREAANAYVEKHYLIFESQLGDGPYLLGTTFSVADIYVWMLAQWMDQAWLQSHCPKVSRLAQAVAARPAIAPVHHKHFGVGIG